MSRILPVAADRLEAASSVKRATRPSPGRRGRILDPPGTAFVARTLSKTGPRDLLHVRVGHPLPESSRVGSACRLIWPVIVVNATKRLLEVSLQGSEWAEMNPGRLNLAHLARALSEAVELDAAPGWLVLLIPEKVNGAELPQRTLHSAMRADWLSLGLNEAEQAGREIGEVLEEILDESGVQSDLRICAVSIGE